MNQVLNINNLKCQYGDKIILNNVNMKINEGSFVSVIGPNACGKTSLLKMIAGIIPNKFVSIYGKVLDSKKNKEDLNIIGCVFKDYSNFLFEDVYHELAFPLENLNINKVKIDKKIQSISKNFEIENLLDKKCSDLKKEEAQLIQIVIALIHEPKILILDNSICEMRNSLKRKVILELRKLQTEKELTIIMSTNNLEDIVYSDYTYVINDTKIVMEGKTISIFEQDSYLKNIGLELPFSLDLSMMLKFYDIYDSLSVDYNEVISKLWN